MSEVAKIPIATATAIDGLAYEFNSEFGVAHTRDYRIAVELLDGRHLVHKTYLALGKRRDSEGVFWETAPAEAIATAMAARVQAAGEIDPSLWEELEEESESAED